MRGVGCSAGVPGPAVLPRRRHACPSVCDVSGGPRRGALTAPARRRPSRLPARVADRQLLRCRGVAYALHGRSAPVPRAPHPGHQGGSSRRLRLLAAEARARTISSLPRRCGQRPTRPSWSATGGHRTPPGMHAQVCGTYTVLCSPGCAGLRSGPAVHAAVCALNTPVGRLPAPHPHRDSAYGRREARARSVPSLPLIGDAL